MNALFKNYGREGVQICLICLIYIWPDKNNYYIILEITSSSYFSTYKISFGLQHLH